MAVRGRGAVDLAVFGSTTYRVMQLGPCPVLAVHSLNRVSLGRRQTIKIVTIEREYGSGGGEIAQLLAKQLGWKLWDQQLTEEIARLAECPKAVVERREERTDPLYYRLFKSFLRGSYEGSLNAHKLKLVDSECILRLTEAVVLHAAKNGNSVIVGRGSQQFPQESPGHVACVSLRAKRR